MSDAKALEVPAAKVHGPAHHRVHVLGIDGKAGESVTLPLAFSMPVRPDLIQRAVVAFRSHRIQPHGTKLTAGARHSVRWSGKGKGVARTPRLMDSMRGAQSPNTVGGRPAHPPKVERIWAKKINAKERQAAFASSLAATRDPALATARGHTIPEGMHLPIVVADPVEELATTAEAWEFLERIQLLGDLSRAEDSVHERAGRGKRRGRRLRRARGILVVTSAVGKGRGFKNLPGVDVVPAARLSSEDLAPGGDPGRLTLYSRTAVDELKSRLREAKL
ncbi:MAG: 50S ribosomal protein L4 [Thermoplasmata archaeon]|nr:50S ribosomal protein L4 [Thermoplasmata archaeon]